MSYFTHLLHKIFRQYIFSDVGYVFAAKVFGALITFTLHILISRHLGVEDGGFFFYLLSLCIFLTGICCVGMENSIVRIVSSRRPGSATVEVGQYFICSLIIGVTISIILTCTIAITPDDILTLIFGAESAIKDLKLIVFAIPLLTLMSIVGLTLQGLMKGIYSVFVINIIHQAAFLIILSLLISLDLISDIYSIYKASISISIIVGSAILYKEWPTIISHLPNRLMLTEFLKTSLNMFPVSLFTLFLTWSPILVLGYFSPGESVGLFNAASRSAILLSFALASINIVYAPKFSNLHQSRDISGLRSASIESSRLATAFSIPLVITIAIFSRHILSLFGDDYISASTTLIILSIGHAVNAISGPVGNLLLMTENTKLLKRNQFVASTVCLLLSIFLIAEFDELGAAISATISLISLNTFNWISVYNKLQIKVLPWSTL